MAIGELVLAGSQEIAGKPTSKHRSPELLESTSIVSLQMHAIQTKRNAGTAAE
jgi:hypothetical protein